PRLLLHKPPEIHLGRVARVDDAGIVRSDTFGITDLRRRCGNEGGHLPILDAADPDALFEALVALLVGLGIGHVDHVVLVDEDTARPTKLSPLGDEVSIRVEDLDAAVDAIADIKPTARVECDAMRSIEFALPLAVLAPGLEQSSVLVIFHDPILAARA